jgi:hypothetical protein
MKTYQLSVPGILDPFWFGRVRSGEHGAVVAADGTVTVEGVALRFSVEALPAAAAVRVWLNAQGFFTCASVEEVAARDAARREQALVDNQRHKARLNELRSDAQTFNARITLPVKWDVGIKDVLSGLTETSWGDGRSKATVEHIYLLEPLEAGRLTRKEGDLLCTSASGTNGKRWSGKIVERCHDGEGVPYQAKVTCKACLAAAKRWMKE